MQPRDRCEEPSRINNLNRESAAAKSSQREKVGGLNGQIHVKFKIYCILALKIWFGAAFSLASFAEVNNSSWVCLSVTLQPQMVLDTQ